MIPAIRRAVRGPCRSRVPSFDVWMEPRGSRWPIALPEPEGELDRCAAELRMRGSATMNRSEREEIHETSDHVERRLPRWLLRGAEQVGPRANPRRLERGPGAVLTGPARLGGHAAVRARDVRGHGIALAVGGRPGRGLHEQRAEGGLLKDAGKSGLEQHAAGA